MHSILRSARPSLQNLPERASMLLRQLKHNFSTSPSTRQQPYSAPALTRSDTHLKKTTILDIYQQYHEKRPITAVTAHDYITGKFANDSNADMVLIGDSLAMVQLGYPSTNQLKFDEFLYVAGAVNRAVNHKYLIADLPFGSFESSTSKAIESCAQIFSRCENIQAVKIEGGTEYVDRFAKLHDVGFSVVGHCGLTPQRYNFLGGYKLQGNQSVEQGLETLRTCLDLQNKGKVKMLLLECIPQMLAKVITENLSIPTIGIGAGRYCSAQILVQADLLGMTKSKKAKFVKTYNNFYEQAVQSLNQYDAEVKEASFPGSEFSYKMNREIYQELQEKAKQLVKSY